MSSSQQFVTFICIKDTGVRITVGVKLQGGSDTAWEGCLMKGGIFRGRNRRQAPWVNICNAMM